MGSSLPGSILATSAVAAAIVVLLVSMGVQSGLLENQPYLYSGGGSDGDGGEPGLAEINNTVLIDGNATNPVIAGHYVVGSVINQYFVNLTSNKSYSVVNADDVAIANLTAKGGHIGVYDYDVDSFGTWSLYNETDWDLFGTLADPILSYDITTSALDQENGTFIHVVDGRDPSTEATVSACNSTVTDYADAGTARTLYVTVPSDGGRVEVKQEWTTTLDGDTDVAEFNIHMQVRSERTREDDVPVLGGMADATTKSESDSNTAITYMEPGSDVYGELEAVCRARGPEPIRDDDVVVDIVAEAP